MCSSAPPQRIPRQARLNKNEDRMCDFGSCRKHANLFHTSVHPDLRLCRQHCNEDWNALVTSWDQALLAPKRRSRTKQVTPRCQACGCKETSALRPVYQGLFCHDHELELTAIRMHLVDAKKDGDLQLEWIWRQEEILFRKTQESSHMHYQYLIEKCLDS